MKVRAFRLGETVMSCRDFEDKNAGGQNHNPKMICQGETFCFGMFQEHINFWVLNMKVRAFRFRKTTKILLICKILMNIDEEKMEKNVFESSDHCLSKRIQ